MPTAEKGRALIQAAKARKLDMSEYHARREERVQQAIMKQSRRRKASTQLYPRQRAYVWDLPTKRIDPNDLPCIGTMCYCCCQCPKGGDDLWRLCIINRCGRMTADAFMFDEMRVMRRVRLESFRVLLFAK